MSKVKKFLKDNNIKFKGYKHPPVYTCDDVEKHYQDIPGPVFKSLFLKSKEDNQYFLAILPADKRVDFNKFAEVVGVKKVSLASKEKLDEKLGVEPGSVSPFSLINDVDGEVLVYMDKSVYEADVVSFHPNINTETLALSSDDFKRFLNLVGNDFRIIEF